jgi:hypothetical protein
MDEDDPRATLQVRQERTELFRGLSFLFRSDEAAKRQRTVLELGGATIIVDSSSIDASFFEKYRKMNLVIISNEAATLSDEEMDLLRSLGLNYAYDTMILSAILTLDVVKYLKDGNTALPSADAFERLLAAKAATAAVAAAATTAVATTAVPVDSAHVDVAVPSFHSDVDGDAVMTDAVVSAAAPVTAEAAAAPSAPTAEPEQTATAVPTPAKSMQTQA